MNKRLLLIVSLVIVLVSLNWFSEVFAGDIDNLTPEQKAILLKKLNNGRASEADQYYWETPQLFEREGSAKPMDGIPEA